ncbi:MAG: GNAT family N-acetyltransferase [Terracidiphilus sp.]
MLYRPYAPPDFAALYAIEEICFQPPLRFPRAYMRRLVDSSNSATWIAEEDSRLAGFAIVEWDRAALGPLAYIQTIEVLSKDRGHGVGAELLRRIEVSARDAGAHTIWLHVDAENSAAIHLYESRGYKRQGREENYYPRGRPALIYEKNLGAA